MSMAFLNVWRRAGVSRSVDSRAPAPAQSGLHPSDLRSPDGEILSKPNHNSNAEQRLVPRRPPGRSNRKARAFAQEIGRLRAEGYSFDVIREALADAGVVVSNSTVQREAARARSQAAALPDPVTPPGS